MNRIIEEIFTKENERYNLRGLGFFKTPEYEAALCLKEFPLDPLESLSSYRERALDNYYRLRGFGLFCREHIREEMFEKGIFIIMKRELVQRIKGSTRTDTDKYLAPENDSVSFLLTEKQFQEIYALNFGCIRSTFNTPEELRQYCDSLLNTYFPLEEKSVISEFIKNTTPFWEKFYIKIRPICSAICFRMSGAGFQNFADDFWSDTCVVINRFITSESRPSNLNARSIISYAVGILKNKNRELGRLRRKANIDIDNLKYKLTGEDEELFFNNPATLSSNFKSHDFHFSTNIDIQDQYAVRGYFVVILYNEDHPLHNELTEGLQDKITNLFLHYIDGISYEEIVHRNKGNITEKEMAKEAARLRQEIKRVKETLLKRYYKLMEKYR